MNARRTISTLLTGVVCSAMLVGAGAAATAAAPGGVTLDDQGLHLPAGTLLRDLDAVSVLYLAHGEYASSSVVIDPSGPLAGASFLAWSSLPGVPIDSCITSIEVRGHVDVPAARFPVCGIDLVEQPTAPVQPTTTHRTEPVVPDPPVTEPPVTDPPVTHPTVTEHPLTVTTPTPVPTTGTSPTKSSTPVPTKARPTTPPPARSDVRRTDTGTRVVSHPLDALRVTRTSPRAVPPALTPDPEASRPTGRVLAHTGSELATAAWVAAALVAIGGVLVWPVRRRAAQRVPGAHVR